METVILCISGAGMGALVAAGMFALITTVGVITRLADKTHTAGHIKKYETAITVGALIGNALFMLKDNSIFHNIMKSEYPEIIVFVLCGLFTGIFVGCLATALAEAVKVTAIFSRRIKLHRGVGIIILSVAFGKVAGTVLFFIMEMYKK